MATWQRNLYVLWVAELVAIAGFSVVSPFLPYYVQHLGVSEPREVALWSGALYAGQAVAMAVFAPIWGAVADRFGRKLMVERAMFGGAVVLAAMGLVQNVQQLVILRTTQGILTGTVSAAMTLVASSTPRERSGYALGLLQMAVWIGASVGPLLGGVVADTWGYRAAFVVTGGLLFLAGLTVWGFVREDRRPNPREMPQDAGSFWHGLSVVARSRSLVSLYAVEFLGRSANYLLLPLLPLFIQSLVPESSRVASTTGLISGVSAATSAAGAVLLGRAGDRIGHRRLLLPSLACVAILYIPTYFVTSPWQLMLLQSGVGMAIGGVLASLGALLAQLAPEGLHGAVYGVDASVTSLAGALGPLIGASIAASWGLRAPFLLTAAAFALASGLASALLPRAPRATGRSPGE